MKLNRGVYGTVCAWVLAGSSLFPAIAANAKTVAYWRFEEGPEGANVPHGGQGDGVFFAGVPDRSGNDYALSAWNEGFGGFIYQTDVPAAVIPQTGEPNKYGVRNKGPHPCLWNNEMRSWSPKTWTVEAAFQPESKDYRTLVGRDSQGSVVGKPGLAALYLQVQPDQSLAIKFCDVSGFWHEAISSAGLVQTFDHPDSGAGVWQAAAVVSDGDTLSLYYKNIEHGDTDYRLVAQTDLKRSGSPDRALAAGTGDGEDWDAGDFTVGRGLHNGGHTDRAYGFIDEVRISDTALTPAEFLFSVRAVTRATTSAGAPPAAGAPQPRRANPWLWAGAIAALLLGIAMLVFALK